MRYSTRSIAKASSRPIALVALLLVAGCGGRARPAPEVRIETAPVIVAAGCVRGRPAAIVPLKARIPADEWARRAPGAKARSIEAQAGERMNHADALAAATSGCPVAPGLAR